MEAQDLLKLVGFEAEEGKEPDMDAVRNHFNKAFVPVTDINEKNPIVEKIIGSSYGQKMGSLTSSFIKHAKESGLDIKHSDFADKKIDDVIPDIFGRFKERIDAVKKPDSKIEEELKKWKDEASTYKETVETLQNQITEKEAGFENQKKTWLVNHAENEAWNSINFAPTANDLMKRGFKSTIKEKYDFTADDEGKVWPVYKDGDKKGSRVQNPNKLSDMMTLPDLLNHEAAKAELLAKPNEGKPGAPAKTGAPQKAEQQNNNVRVNPRFANQA